MRIFKNCEEAIDEVTRDVFARGINAFDKTWQGIVVERSTHEMKEMINYSYCIKSIKDRNKLIDFTRKYFNKKDITRKWADAWFKDRISGKSIMQPSYKLRAKYWEPMLEKDNTFAYTYESRMVELHNIITAMKRNLYMRGACLTIFETTRDISNIGKRRVPCSMYYHFIVRHEEGLDKLSLIYSMRSCDLANHFSVDVYIALRLLEFVAKELNIEPGYFYHNIDSLHVYKKDVHSSKKW